jgi:hypothetical protein
VEKKPLKPLGLTDEELKQAAAAKQRYEGQQIPVDPEWYFIAKFGKHYGWDGIMAILNNEINMETATMLYVAAEKVEAGGMLANAQASFIGAAAANGKNPSKSFRTMTAHLRRASKVNE